MTAPEQASLPRRRRARSRMRLRKTWVLNGPNAWTNRPAVRLLLDTGNPTGAARARLDQLLASFSTDPETRESSEESEFIPPETNEGALLAAVVMDLQHLAGDHVDVNISSKLDHAGRYEVVCECLETDLAETAASVAVRFLDHLVYQTGQRFDLNREFAQHVMSHIRYRESQLPQQAAIAAARSKRIPVRYVDKPQRLVEFGLGAYTERFLATLTSKSIEIASRLARNKPMAKEILREHGLPVADGFVVSNAAEAIRAADHLGYPLVVKPTDLKHGTGVTVGVHTLESLEVAVQKALAASHSGQALVETMIRGQDLRILIVGDRVVGAQERVPAFVVGNGHQTIADLVAELNADPRRQPEHPARVHLVPVDDGMRIALELQDLTFESVLEPGRRVPVKIAANLHQGGAAVSPPLESIHPDNIAVARLAARAVGLDMCGLDLITPDFTKSIWEVGGAIIEVNSEPGFRLIINPDSGPPQDVGLAIIEMFYPPGRPYQPTIITLPPAHGQDAPARLIKHIMRAAGMTVGLATQHSTEFDGSGLAVLRAASSPEIERVARNPYVTGAIFEIGQRDIEERGLPFRQVDVAVLGYGEPVNPAPAARHVDSVLASLVSPNGAIIFGPDDLHIVSMHADATQRHILVSGDPDHVMIAGHLQKGGSVVTTKDGAIIHRTSQFDLPILALESIGTIGRRASLCALLQAVAAGVAMNVPVEAIRDSLGESFTVQHDGEANVL